MSNTYMFVNYGFLVACDQFTVLQLLHQVYPHGKDGKLKNVCSIL